MHKKRWAITFLTLILSVSIAIPQRVWAADNYTHDADLSRDNTVLDTGFTGLTYNNNPYYVEINQWNGHAQHSNTTPSVVGNELYQYTFDDYGKGYLTQINLTKPQSEWTLGGGASLNETLIATFDEGFSGANGEVNNAAGVSGPTITQGYLAIAVGEYLYWWPVGHPEKAANRQIYGNPGNTINLIAASPLITPPESASGVNIASGQPVSWQTPYAIVGSWSGGLISQPLYIPTNVIETSFNYKTTYDASNATNDIVTSSPAWNPRTTVVGNGAAVFGVDAAQSGKYRLILMNPATGSHKSIYTDQNGSPIFYGPIDSSPVVVDKTKFPSAPVPDGTIFVPDQGAAVYELSADGSYMADDTSAMDQYNPCIANIAVDGENVIWVGKGHTTLNTTHIETFGGGGDSYQLTNFVGLNSPAVVRNGSADTLFLASTSSTGLAVMNPMNTSDLSVQFQNNKYTPQKLYAQTLGSVTPNYTSVAADVGTDSTDGSQLHYIATWTNAGFDDMGSVELWTPAPLGYSVTATATPNIVNSGEQVFIQAVPSPEGITKSITAHVTDGGKNTIDLTLGKTWTSPEKWSQALTAPNNYTGAEDQYTVNVTATSTWGQTATATTNFTVEPIPLPPPGNLSGTLKIDAWRRNNTIQPPGTAKYGDKLVATLTVDTPPPPPGLLNAVVTGARLTKAWVHTPKGKVNDTGVGPDLILRSEVNTDMSINGLTATTSYTESWAGYPPPIPDNTVMETDDIYAPFAVHVDYKYQVPVPTKNGVIFIWQTGSYDASGNASTSLDITGTEWYIYSEAIKDSGTPVWEP